LAERERTRDREIAQAKEIEKAYTELKATQAQLIQSEKMASLGELTAGIAHEIQNPLNFVNNFSEINTELVTEMKDLLAGNKVTGQSIEELNLLIDDVLQNLQKINQHGKRAENIVKNMLLHSRTGGGEEELTDINFLCEEYLKLSYHGFRAKDNLFIVDLVTQYEPGIEKINIVPQDVGRVLMNLYNNAFYSMEEKRKKNITGYEPAINVSTKSEGEKIKIIIRDNGMGISKKYINKVLQPFFTTKPTGVGTGLGLSLSYDIIKAYGGDMTVDSVEGEYATFTIELSVN
jgi:signal transduction histidine kinase